MESYIVFISFILFVLTAFVAGILFFLLRRALDRNAELEEMVTVLENQNTEALNANGQFYTWFEELKNRLVYSYQRIKSIDAKGAFEADDEVGYFFKELKELIERLHQMGVMDETEKEEALNVTAPKITTEELKNVLAKRNASTLTREEK